MSMTFWNKKLGTFRTIWYVVDSVYISCVACVTAVEKVVSYDAAIPALAPSYSTPIFAETVFVAEFVTVVESDLPNSYVSSLSTHVSALGSSPPP